MYNKFIRTENVKCFISLMDNLQKAPPSVSKMALVYGEFGLGKSQAIMWWVTNNDAIYVRCNHKISTRWLLTEIVKELDEEPCYCSQNLFRQIEDKLKFNPKVIVVDEIDYLFTNTHTIETLRDIHDKLGVPILLVGMGLADKKIQKYGHINDRIFAKLRFEKLTKNDIKEIITTLSEVKFTPEVIEFLINHKFQFRQIVKIITKAENISKMNRLEQIDKSILQEILNEE
jgi:DNA transposition AAA+ family ATPase